MRVQPSPSIAIRVALSQLRGTTLGERIAAGGAVGEYTYKGDDYDGARKVGGFGCVALQLCNVTSLTALVPGLLNVLSRVKE